MKILLDVEDGRAEFLIELLRQFEFVDEATSSDNGQPIPLEDAFKMIAEERQRLGIQ